MMDVKCPSCGETYHVSEEHAGKSLRCRRCGQVFEIAAPARAAAASQATGGAAPGVARGTGAPAAPVDVTDATFGDAVLRASKPVVVDFWAAWCGPCRAISPVVQQLAGEYAGKVAFAKLNADENPRTTQQFGVMGLPTLLFFRDGKEVGRLVGAHPKPAIKRAVDQLAAA